MLKFGLAPGWRVWGRGGLYTFVKDGVTSGWLRACLTWTALYAEIDRLASSDRAVCEVLLI